MFVACANRTTLLVTVGEKSLAFVSELEFQKQTQAAQAQPAKLELNLQKLITVGRHRNCNVQFLCVQIFRERQRTLQLQGKISDMIAS